MYRLLALDLDDTLVNSQRIISQKNKSAIQAAREKGTIITILTGRSYVNTRPVCEELELDSMPVVTFGGAKIVSYPDDQILYQELLTSDMVREVLHFAAQEKVYAQVYDGDVFCYNEETEESRYYAQRLGQQGRQVDFATTSFDNSPKVLVTVQPEALPALYEKAKVALGDKYQITPSSQRFLEFYHLGNDKGMGLAWLGKHYGIMREEMIAMGAMAVDAPMLR